MGRETFEDKVLKNMRLLHCSRAEAEEIVRDEEIIDKGGKCDWEVELTPEQKKAQRAARRADRVVPTEKKTNHRGPDENKRAIMEAIREVVAANENAADVIVTNVEREMTFVYNGVNYKVVLSAPRPEKK